MKVLLQALVAHSLGCAAGIRVLMDEPRTVGMHRVTWDGKDDDGHTLASGVYFHRLETGGVTHVGKMVLMK